MVRSLLNYITEAGGTPVFDPPLVGFADGADPIFDEFKTLVGSDNITPAEALAGATGEAPSRLPPVYVIAWTPTHSLPVIIHPGYRPVNYRGGEPAAETQTSQKGEVS